MADTDPGIIAHKAAIDRVHGLFEVLEAAGGDEDAVDWAETPALAPFDGCVDCVVRETLAAGIQSLADQNVDLRDVQIITGS